MFKKHKIGREKRHCICTPGPKANPREKRDNNILTRFPGEVSNKRTTKVGTTED